MKVDRMIAMELSVTGTIKSDSALFVKRIDL